MENINYTNIINIEKWTNLFIQYGLQVLFALIILAIGWIFARFIRDFIRKIMRSTHLDETLSIFLSNIVYILVLAFVLIATLNKIGIQTTSLVAVIGAAGLAIGLALQGSLSNFAAGIIIIFFRHFRVGDTIKFADITGTVEALDIFNTILITPDNQKVIVPNAKLTENAITNFSSKPIRRLNIIINIKYDSDIILAKSIISDIIASDERVLKDKEIRIAVSELTINSVVINAQCWTKKSEYPNAYSNILEKIKLCFDAKGISMYHT